MHITMEMYAVSVRTICPYYSMEVQPGHRPGAMSPTMDRIKQQVRVLKKIYKLKKIAGLNPM